MRRALPRNNKKRASYAPLSVVAWIGAEMEFALSQAVASGDAFEHRPSECGGGIDLRALTREHPQTHAAGGEVLHGVDQMGEVTAETVEFPDHEHVGLPQGAQAAVDSGPVVAYAGSEVVVEVGRVVDARGPQGIALQVQRLGAIRL